MRSWHRRGEVGSGRRRSCGHQFKLFRGMSLVLIFALFPPTLSLCSGLFRTLIPLHYYTLVVSRSGERCHYVPFRMGVSVRDRHYPANGSRDIAYARSRPVVSSGVAGRTDSLGVRSTIVCIGSAFGGVREMFVRFRAREWGNLDLNNFFARVFFSTPADLVSFCFSSCLHSKLSFVPSLISVCMFSVPTW